MKFAILVLTLMFGFNLSCATSSKTRSIEKNREALAERREAMDQQNWIRAEKENTSQAYRAYLRDKSGKYGETARQRIEENKWSLAQAINNTQSYGRYLTEYPNGLYSQTARERIAKTPSDTVFPDQKNQLGKKIGNWAYILTLINYVKGNIDSDISKEAVSEISALLEGNFPKNEYNHSHSQFDSEYLKALRENRPFVIAFGRKNQPAGGVDAIVQELGGLEVIIDKVDLDWKGNKCHTAGYSGTWSMTKLKDIKIDPYGNRAIGPGYSIPCESFSYFALELWCGGKKIVVPTSVIPRKF